MEKGDMLNTRPVNKQDTRKVIRGILLDPESQIHTCQNIQHITTDLHQKYYGVQMRL